MSMETNYTKRPTNDTWPDESGHMQNTADKNGGWLNGVLMGVFIGGLVPACSIFLYTYFVVFPAAGTGWSGLEPFLFSFIGLIFGGLIGGLIGGMLGWIKT